MPVILGPPVGRRRVRLGLVVLTTVVATGTLWYWLLEHFSFVDALYQSVFTIATVGFSEVEPLGDRGRLFTTVFIIVGVGVALYTLAGGVEYLVDHHLGRLGRWRMRRQIESLRGHIVVCGYGRVGQTVVARLGDGPHVVVVDSDERACETAAASGFVSVCGDSTDDDVLREAGIERAGTVIVSLHSDADAISTVLSVRALNASARVVARANDASSEAKLVRAGVDHVVNPLSLGARRLATFALQPAVADFMDVVMPERPANIRIEELVVAEGSRVAERTVAGSSIGDSGAQLLAVRHPGGSFDGAPGPETTLAAGSTVIAMGTEEQLEAMARSLQGESDDR